MYLNQILENPISVCRLYFISGSVSSPDISLLLGPGGRLKCWQDKYLPTLDSSVNYFLLYMKRYIKFRSKYLNLKIASFS